MSIWLMGTRSSIVPDHAWQSLWKSWLHVFIQTSLKTWLRLTAQTTAACDPEVRLQGQLGRVFFHVGPSLLAFESRQESSLIFLPALALR